MTDQSPTHFEDLRASYDAIPHCVEAGIRVEDVSFGHARMSVDWRDDLVGNPDTGVLHGAVITTVMDTTGGLAAMSAAPSGTAAATLDLRIDYLKPATPRQRVYADTECYRITANVAFVRGWAHHGDRDDPIATCAATFMLNATGFRVPQGGATGEMPS